MSRHAQVSRNGPAQGKASAAQAKAGKAPSAARRGPLEREAEREGAALEDAVRKGGAPREGNAAFADLRRAAERRYGRDLGRVALDASPGADLASRQLGAEGFTVGADIHLGRAARGGGGAGVSTLAHEMVHAVQQTGGGQGAGHATSAPVAVARREQAMGEQLYSVKLNRLEHLLSYRFFDWAITDEEAAEALELLESMGSAERAAALGGIRVDRLMDNLPLESQRQSLGIMLKQTEGMRAAVQDVNRLLDTHVFDWAVTDADAVAALEMLEKLPAPERHYAVFGINRLVLMDNLPDVHRIRFHAIWEEAQAWWNRQRQQRDPLKPGDQVRIRVFNTMAGAFEDDYFPPARTYQVSEADTLVLPMVGEIDIRGLRPEHIQQDIASRLVTGDFLYKTAVSVEVVVRRGELFQAEDFRFAEGQPDTPLQPGDTFQLMVVESNRLEEESDFTRVYRIDPGGTVDLPYIGRVAVGGMNKVQIVAEITRRFDGWFHQPPTVWVWVQSQGEATYKPPQALDRPTVVSRHSTREWLANQKPLLIPRRTAVDPYLDFYRSKSAELEAGKQPEKDKRLGRDALFRYMEWVSDNSGDEDALNASNPYAVYGDIHTTLLIADIKKSSREKVLADKEARWQAEHDVAVKAKLDEYWAWALRMWKEAGKTFTSAGRAYLITEHPYRKIGMTALTDAVLSWAHANTDHPRFKYMSPAECADMLLQEDQALATVFKLGMEARPRLEYFPELDRTRRTLGDTAVEMIVGILPIAGEAQDANDLLTGTSITGEELGTGDRVLAGICLIIPFVGRGTLRGGDELADTVVDLATKTGRSVDEVEDLIRVAGNLTRSDAVHIERIMETVAGKKKLTDADLDILDDIARKLKGPLEELAQSRKSGSVLAVKPLRVDPVTATKLVPGTSAHMSQRWLEYQVRNPQQFPRLTGVIDPKWERLYNTIIANKKAGGKFEGEVMDWLASGTHPGLLKNNQMMIPSDGSITRGFIPDGVKGNPAELVYGQPYHFVEVKGWKEMSNTGNLKAMVDYVSEFGGHIEVVFRSSKHADGATTLTGPMTKALDDLVAAGKATVRRYP